MPASQIFYPDRGDGDELWLLGQRGFSAEAARRWEWVTITTPTTCQVSGYFFLQKITISMPVE